MFFLFSLSIFISLSLLNTHYFRYLWPVIYVLGLVAGLCGVLLPRALQAIVLRGHTAAMDPATAAFTATGMLNCGVVCNYLHLGATEFVNHAVPFDFAARLTARSEHGEHPTTAGAGAGAKAAPAGGSSAGDSTAAPTTAAAAAATASGRCGPLGSRVHLAYAAGDFWAPLACEARAAASGLATTRLQGDIPHAFGVRGDGAPRKVAAWTAGHLKSVLERDSKGGY